MLRLTTPLLAVLALAGCGSSPPPAAPPAVAAWPQAGGPDGSWRAEGKPAPTEWSVTLDKNILWRTPLPNGGQSGICVWVDRLFLTTFAENAGDENMYSADILGHAVDANTGEILWSVPLNGSEKSPMMYTYSDSTTPTPVTDGETVVFTNASGVMLAVDFEGNGLWRHEWKPWGKPFPFNKQHEPILVDDVVLNVEPLDGNPADKEGWNYLRAIDVKTGETRWIAEDATTTYTTSVLGRTAEGKPAVMTGRGGWHDVPERPIGLSLIDLSPGNEGKTLWRFVASTGADGEPLDEPGSLQAPTWQTLYLLHWDAEHAYWFRLNPKESHLVLDSKTGGLVAEHSLIEGVDYRPWDPETGKHRLLENVNLREVRDWSPRVDQQPDEVIRVMPAWHANMVAGGYHYFLASTAHRRNRLGPKGKGGPSHCIGRVNLTTGKTEYFELPVTVIRKPGEPDEFVYGVEVRTKTENSRGVDVAAEDRSRRDGWQIPAFWGSPTAINGNIYFTTMIGVTYVIDADAPVLDENALLAVNDLGPSGETWSLNSISYADGRLYHRSLKELVAIGE